MKLELCECCRKKYNDYHNWLRNRDPVHQSQLTKKRRSSGKYKESQEKHWLKYAEENGLTTANEGKALYQRRRRCENSKNTQNMVS